MVRVRRSRSCLLRIGGPLQHGWQLARDFAGADHVDQHRRGSVFAPTARAPSRHALRAPLAAGLSSTSSFMATLDKRVAAGIERAQDRHARTGGNGQGAGESGRYSGCARICRTPAPSAARLCQRRLRTGFFSALRQATEGADQCDQRPRCRRLRTKFDTRQHDHRQQRQLLLGIGEHRHDLRHHVGEQEDHDGENATTVTMAG